ncbi:hypothetical protein F5B20DRAFT_575130 [Whalleya microplaca]|nr:hypothetical protein F5B20DRAFT_575130 [Whalleya microplaca]
MPPIHCANASSTASAAKLFLQLCARRTTVTNSSSSSILDLLLPPRPPPARALHLRSPRTVPLRSSRGRNLIAHHVKPPPPRPFSTSGPWRKTAVLYNPQRDEEGKEMMLEITPRAANRLSQIMAKDANPHLALRIQVESGGCHGFQYLMSLTSLPPSLPANTATPPPNPPSPPSTDTTAPAVTPSTTTSAAPTSGGIGEDDTVFAFVPDAPSDTTPEDTRSAPKIVLDGPSLELLHGSKVDFTMELIGSQFKIVDNPAATSSCGCGTSFDIKI